MNKMYARAMEQLRIVEEAHHEVKNIDSFCHQLVALLAIAHERRVIVLTKEVIIAMAVMSQQVIGYASFMANRAENVSKLRLDLNEYFITMRVFAKTQTCLTEDKTELEERFAELVREIEADAEAALVVLKESQEIQAKLGLLLKN